MSHLSGVDTRVGLSSEALARRLGIHGTPVWLVGGLMVPGLFPREQFEKLAQALAA